MEIGFLGSGGNSPIPMPTCACALCREARERGVPYARNGNSMHLPGIDAVVDAPEQTFANLNRAGVADLHLLDDEPLAVGDTRVEAVPYSLSGDGDLDATGFLLEDGDATVAVVSDDARYLDEDRLPDGIDLAVFECGLFERAPDGTRLLDETDREVLADELSHEEVLARIDRVGPDRTVLTEIEHLYGRSHDDYRELAAGYEDVTFAYDGLEVHV